MTTRREWLQRMMAAGGLLALDPRTTFAAEGKLITRAIPATGERLPIVGLGSSATFARVARGEDVSALRAVLAKMVELGGTVFDTAPAYGASEEVAGRIAQELGTRLWPMAQGVHISSPAGKTAAAIAVLARLR